jgi:hypothetical protein
MRQRFDSFHTTNLRVGRSNRSGRAHKHLARKPPTRNRLSYHRATAAGGSLMDRQQLT